MALEEQVPAKAQRRKGSRKALSNFLSLPISLRLCVFAGTFLFLADL
jgi:hypothetical protein